MGHDAKGSTKGLWSRLFGRTDRAAAATAPATDEPEEPAAPPIGVAAVPPAAPTNSLRQALLFEVRRLRADKRVDEAIFMLETALQDAPDDVELHGELHDLCRRAGDPYATLAHGQRWVRSLARAGRMRDALEALRELHAIDEDFRLEDAEASVPLAQLAMRDGARELAVGLVDGFDRRFPGHAAMPTMYFLGARLLSEHWQKHAQAAQMIRGVIAHYGDHAVADEARAYLVALDARIGPAKG
jgi:tetratricopeptide (TPR) repeat protein